jgi:hypothetical protein
MRAPLRKGIGTLSLGVAAPSQKISNLRPRSASGERSSMVSHMRSMVPAPWMSARVWERPTGIVSKAWPLAPVGFSGLTQRVSLPLW